MLLPPSAQGLIPPPQPPAFAEWAGGWDAGLSGIQATGIAEALQNSAMHRRASWGRYPPRLQRAWERRSLSNFSRIKAENKARCLTTF